MRSRLISAAIAAAVAGTLYGCAGLLSAPPPAPPPIVATLAQCPAIHEFTPAQNKALADALRALPTGSIWHDVAEDDQKMRAQTRACNASK